MGRIFPVYKEKYAKVIGPQAPDPFEDYVEFTEADKYWIKVSLMNECICMI